jgi:hypothetical protein
MAVDSEVPEVLESPCVGSVIVNPENIFYSIQESFCAVIIIFGPIAVSSF